MIGLNFKYQELDDKYRMFNFQRIKNIDKILLGL